MFYKTYYAFKEIPFYAAFFVEFIDQGVVPNRVIGFTEVGKDTVYRRVFVFCRVRVREECGQNVISGSIDLKSTLIVVEYFVFYAEML